MQDFRKKLSKVDIDSLYVSEIYYNGEKRGHFRYENLEASQSQVDLQKLIDSNFNGVLEAQIRCRPSKLLGYFPITKYKSDLDSQKEMMTDLLKFDGKSLYADDFFDYPDALDYESDVISFDSEGWNGDYGKIHGDSHFFTDTEDCESLDARLYGNENNDAVLEEFWNCTLENELQPHLKKLDPDSKICVYHRKGKEWYIGYQYEDEQIFITYCDEDGEIQEEEQYAFYYREDFALVQKIKTVLNSYKEDVAAQSYINNALGVGCYYVDCADNEVVSYLLIDLIYESRWDLRNDIMEIINYNGESIEQSFLEAYSKAIKSNTKVLNDLTVQITTVPLRMVENSASPETKNYNHLKLIKRLESRYGYKLVKTAVSDSLSNMQWAIKQGDEEYHFDIFEVVANDVEGEQTLKEFIIEVLGALEKRKLEKISQAELFEKASRVFVGISDSIEAGNCQYGTNQFIQKHHINTAKIGGIRGDVLLQMENSNFTKRAVNHAIIAHGGLAS